MQTGEENLPEGGKIYMGEPEGMIRRYIFPVT